MSSDLFGDDLNQQDSAVEVKVSEEKPKTKIKRPAPRRKITVKNVQKAKENLLSKEESEPVEAKAVEETEKAPAKKTKRVTAKTHKSTKAKSKKSADVSETEAVAEEDKTIDNSSKVPQEPTISTVEDSSDKKEELAEQAIEPTDKTEVKEEDSTATADEDSDSGDSSPDERQDRNRFQRQKDRNNRNNKNKNRRPVE